MKRAPLALAAAAMLVAYAAGRSSGGGVPVGRTYLNSLEPLRRPSPLLDGVPEYVAPVVERARYEAPAIVDDQGADLHVRAWRFSYNARGIIEMPNHLRARETAVIMVHPWGVDDGQGWRTPEPAGAVDFCTPEKNHLAGRHTRDVVSPLLARLRGRVRYTMYSLPGSEDLIRHRLYRSFTHNPTPPERRQAQADLERTLKAFRYRGSPLPRTLTLSADKPVVDYFRQFPGLDAGPGYNNAGFWDLPIPVTRDLRTAPEDVVIYDAAGYAPLKRFLVDAGVRHVLLCGYATDMCFKATTAGYLNLSPDFNVFLVGDATMATFPANESPRSATNAHLSFAALDHLITQSSWIRLDR